VLVPPFQPLTLRSAPAPFSHPDWFFEIKWDGFRALAQIEHGRCRLISRNGNDFNSFRSLSESLGSELKQIERNKARFAMMKEEIVKTGLAIIA
jgi:ATP-dependent DNA ligase